tara:strand:- start:222 stop:890 length:669 start_codon:yes stop_codon:yes gene_type:complete
MFRASVLSCILSLSALIGTSQDVILLQDETSEKVKILEITPKQVSYVRWGSQDGPRFVLPIGEVRMITLKDGHHLVYDKSRKRKVLSQSYGQHMISIAGAFSNSLWANISYEHFTEDGRRSFRVPLFLKTDGSGISSGCDVRFYFKEATTARLFAGPALRLGTHYLLGGTETFGLSALGTFGVSFQPYQKMNITLYTGLGGGVSQRGPILASDSGVSLGLRF